MHISANIDDCAIIIDDFLPVDLFKKISNFNFVTENSSYNEWTEFLFKDENKNLIVEEVTYSKKIAEIIKDQIKTEHLIFKNFLNILTTCPFLPYQKNSRIHITYYEYKKYAGINWHDDSIYTLNYSFYIHDKWDINWGGETLINTGRGLPLSSSPKPNSLLVIKNGVPHKVNCVTGPEKRRVLQIRGEYYSE
jgi:Rps23 Pro-64 3,4-dihydroxylase Tpa1-like proline 4-hydroxylase